MCERFDEALDDGPAAVLDAVCGDWPFLAGCRRRPEALKPLQSALQQPDVRLMCLTRGAAMVAALAGEQVLDLPLDRMDPMRFPNAEMMRDAAYGVLPWHHWTFEFQVLQLMGRPFRQSFSCGPSAPDVMMPAPAWP